MNQHLTHGYVYFYPFTYLDVRCMVDFEAPKGLKAVAPIICPQYEGDGCCTWQQNYALYQNLGTLVDR